MKGHIWGGLLGSLAAAGCGVRAWVAAADPDAGGQTGMSSGGQGTGAPVAAPYPDAGGQTGMSIRGSDAGGPLPAIDGGPRFLRGDDGAFAPECPGEAMVVVRADVGSAPPAACPACTRPPCALATGQQLPGAVAVDERWLYWTTPGRECDGAIVRLAKGGGAPASLVTGEDAPGSLALDAETVYWTAARSVRSVRKDGTAPRVLAGGLTGIEALAVDTERVYFRGYHPTAGNSLLAAPRNGGATSVIAPRRAVRGIASDAAHLYFTTNDFPGGGVFRMEKRDGATAISIVGEQAELWGIALDAQRVYWTKYSSMGGAVLSAGKDGSDPRTIARTGGLGNGPPSVVVDDAHIYWVENHFLRGRIMRARKDGTEVIELASDQTTPNSIAVDRCGVYWSNQGAPQAVGGGSIWFTPR